MKRAFLFFALTAILFTANGCAGLSDSVVANVDISGWDSRDACTVLYENEDTVSLCELSVFVLHERSFPVTTDSLNLMITTITPDSLVYTESRTFYPDRDCIEESPFFHETRNVYRSDVRLMRQGQYIFTFSHDAAVPVKGIRGIGMQISGRRNG